MWETIRDAILAIRKHTNRGSININTNGSNPEAVKVLCDAGLNSIRVSTNSAQPHLYTQYYRPNNYSFEDIVESIKVVRGSGGWASINYFVFPGVTDSEEEFDALHQLIEDTDLNMIQWRNFNIDPDWYLGKMNLTDTGTPMGIKNMMRQLHRSFPNLQYGYFNPPMERIKGDFTADFAGGK
jgi:molybdenum cofactor biosynthesis enzyme MoaA